MLSKFIEIIDFRILPRNHGPIHQYRSLTITMAPAGRLSMKIPGLHRAETEYVDTPQGIFTASGVWFRTRVAWLDAYAGAVLEREPLARLLADAALWLRTPQVLTLWFLPLFLWFFAPLQAALGAIVLYLGVATLGPSFVSRRLLGLLRVLDVVLLQAFYYVFMLSVLAAQERLVAVWVGLGGFIVLRWGLLEMATKPLARLVTRSLYALPVPDHVLRALILRAALRYDVALPEIAQIEREVLATIHRKKDPR